MGFLLINCIGLHETALSPDMIRIADAKQAMCPACITAAVAEAKRPGFEPVLGFNYLYFVQRGRV